MKRMIITIGRQSGSSGRKVGELLAERLSLPLYGKAELQKIAEGTDDYEEVQAFYEEEPVNSLLYAIAMSQFEQEVGRIPFQRIRELASKESCIIIGRCRRPYFQRKIRKQSVSLSMQIPRSVCRESWSGKDFPRQRQRNFWRIQTADELLSINIIQSRSGTGTGLRTVSGQRRFGDRRYS